MSRTVALCVAVWGVFALAASGTHAQTPAPAPAPAPSPLPAPRPAPDVKPPSLTKATLAPKAAKRSRGIVLLFRLNEPASVAGVVMRKRPGVRTRGKRCVKRTRKRRGPRCTRRSRAGKVRLEKAVKGQNRAHLSLKSLARGSYTLELTPTDKAGNVGTTKRVAFRVAG